MRTSHESQHSGPYSIAKRSSATGRRSVRISPTHWFVTWCVFRHKTARGITPFRSDSPCRFAGIIGGIVR